MLIQVSGIDPVRACAKQKGKEENNNNDDHHYNNTYKYRIFTPIVSDESRYRSSDRNSSKYSSTFMNFLLIQVMLSFSTLPRISNLFLLVVVVVVGFVFIAVKFQSCYIFILSCWLCPRFVFCEGTGFSIFIVETKNQLFVFFFYFSAFMKIEIQDILFILFRFCFQLRTLNTRTHTFCCVHFFSLLLLVFLCSSKQLTTNEPLIPNFPYSTCSLSAEIR